MNDNQACCNHCKVVLKYNEHPDGTRSDYWECADGCGTKFWPSTVSEELKTIAEHNQNKYLHAVSVYEDQIARLKRGDFTKEEFQNLCHNRHDKEGCTAKEFYNGCAEFQKQLFGKSERDLFLSLPAAVEMVEKDIITSQGETIATLTNAINSEWRRLYHIPDVTDTNQLVTRIKKIAEDRDCWLATAQNNQKEYLKLEAENKLLKTRVDVLS